MLTPRTRIATLLLLSTLAWLLAACGGAGANVPADDVSATIGADGGTLATADGSATLAIPAGALDAATKVTLGTVAVTKLPALPQGATLLAGSGVKLDVAGNATFAQPVTITLAYDPAKLTGREAPATQNVTGSVQIYVYVNGGWQPAANCTAVDSKVSCTVTQPFAFAVAALQADGNAALTVELESVDGAAAPADGALGTLSGKVALSVRIQAGASPVTAATIEADAGPVLQQVFSPAIPAGVELKADLTLDTTLIPDGSHTLTITVTAQDGTRASKTYSVTIANDGGGDGGDGGGTVDRIGGTVVGWPTGTSARALFMAQAAGTEGDPFSPRVELAAATLGGDGSFLMTLPESVDARFLWSLAEHLNGADCTGSVTVTPADARFLALHQLDVEEGGSPIGMLTLGTRSEAEPIQVGDIVGAYAFFDKAVTIDGEQRCDYGGGEVYVSRFDNASLQAGWNVFAGEITTVVPGETMVFADDLGDSRWHFTGFGPN